MEWIEQMIANLKRNHADKNDGSLRHFLGEIAECDHRVLRVIVNDSV